MNTLKHLSSRWMSLQYVCTEVASQSSHSQSEATSLPPQEMPTIGDHVGGARTYYSFELFLEMRRERENFCPYNKGGLNLKVLIVDLPRGTVCEPIFLRGEQTWKVEDLKSELAWVNCCSVSVFECG